MATPNGTTLDSPDGDKEYYYTVLNLPKAASDHEIRERYRQLSVVFHPDKQTDERKKAAASRQFLQIQKAYQVLSDPVSRRAYDISGPDGLAALAPDGMRAVAEAEFEAELRRRERELARQRVEALAHPSGQVGVGLDASYLFDREREEDESGAPVSLLRHVRQGLGEIRKDSLRVQHRVQMEIFNSTWLALTGRASLKRKTAGKMDFVGTLRHQLSPRLKVEATTSLLQPSTVVVKATHRTDDHVLMCQTELHPAFVQHALAREPGGPILLPPATISVARRLFPKRDVQGTLRASLAPSGPVVALSLSNSRVHDDDPDVSGSARDAKPDVQTHVPSPNGLSLYATHWNFGIELQGLATGLNGSYIVDLLELGVELRSVARLSIFGIAWVLGAEWRGKKTTVGANVSVDQEGVALNIDASYLGQSLNLPIVLSHEHNHELGLWAAVIPSAALALLYHFDLRPLNRKKRVQYLREARRELHEAKSDLIRRWNETVSLLQDTARRHTQAEAASDGLVILEATYGPSEQEEGTEGLDVDVTVPLQALVNASQLYIPGRRSKAGLPGFYDPVAGVAKTVRIRYTFRGRMHYAELPEYMPVVLPLEDHLVE